MRLGDDVIEYAKNKSVVDYLISCGHTPKDTKGKAVKFLSPFRPESKPSFMVYKKTNTWYDWGTGDGGSLIELVMQMENLKYRDAVGYIVDGKIPEKKVYEEKEVEDPIKILYTSKIKDPYLISYLRKRHISLDIANKFCVEAKIKISSHAGNKIRTTIAFPNDKGGYEFRGRDCKISNFPKSISTISKGVDSVRLFEGFSDFLSFGTLYGDRNDTDYIVLNGCGFARSVDLSVYTMVYAYLDNDKAGSEAYESLQANKKDMRYTYYPYNDFNDYLINKRCHILQEY